MSVLGCLRLPGITLELALIRLQSTGNGHSDVSTSGQPPWSTYFSLKCSA